MRAERGLRESHGEGGVGGKVEGGVALAPVSEILGQLRQSILKDSDT